MPRLSHSQIDLFNQCKRWYYLSYLKKVPVFQDDRHLRRGSCFHKIAEWIVQKSPTMEQVKQKFEEMWKHYKLHDFQEKKDETYLMVLEFFNNQPDLTSTELKVYKYNPHFISYMDGVNTDTHIVIDYKTSTWNSSYSPTAYKDQMGRYALMYYKQFGKIPTCEVWFVKYSPIKKVSYTFTKEDIDKYEDEINKINNHIEMYKQEDKYPKAMECGHFCPYKNLCFMNEDAIMFKLYIQGNFLYLQGPMTDVLNKQLERKFSYELKDSYFIKKARPNANTTVRFWDSKRRRLPIGFKTQLIKTLSDYAEWKNKELALDVEDRRKFNETVVNMPEELIGKTLRDYQEEAVKKFIREKVGVLQMATGSGKTLLTTEIIRQLGVKTLVVVNRVELLKQFKDAIEEHLGIEVGMIGRGEENIKDITICTIQTIIKDIKKYENYLSTIRFSIVDETHCVNNKSYWKLANRLVNTEYRLGLSATARRTDGNSMYITAVNGNIVYDLNATELIDKGHLIQPQIIFIKDFISKEVAEYLEQSTMDGLINETEKYSKIYKAMILNNIRNNKIKEIVDKHKGEKILILVKLIEHGEELSTLLNCPYLKGETNKKERDEMMEQFKNGDLNLMIGTLSIFSEGIDIPNLKILINASGAKSDIKSVQTLGRLMRKAEGKDKCIYYDFYDEGKMMSSASRSRIKSFRDEGHKVEFL